MHGEVFFFLQYKLFLTIMSHFEFRYDEQLKNIAKELYNDNYFRDIIFITRNSLCYGQFSRMVQHLHVTKVGHHSQSCSAASFRCVRSKVAARQPSRILGPRLPRSNLYIY